MSYSGYAQGTEEEVKQIFALLEKMLRRVSVRSLFRGPTDYFIHDENGLQYYCSWKQPNQYCAVGMEYISEYALIPKKDLFYELNFEFCKLR